MEGTSEPKRSKSTKRLLFYSPGGFFDEVFVPLSIGGKGCSLFAFFTTQWLKNQSVQELKILAAASEEMLDYSVLEQGTLGREKVYSIQKDHPSFFTDPNEEELEINKEFKKKMKKSAILLNSDKLASAGTIIRGLAEGSYVVSIDNSHFVALRVVLLDEQTKAYFVLDNANVPKSKTLLEAVLASEMKRIPFENLPYEIVCLSMSERHFVKFAEAHPEVKDQHVFQEALDLVLRTKAAKDQEAKRYEREGPPVKSETLKTVRKIFQLAKLELSKKE